MRYKVEVSCFIIPLHSSVGNFRLQPQEQRQAGTALAGTKWPAPKCIQTKASCEEPEADGEDHHNRHILLCYTAPVTAWITYSSHALTPPCLWFHLEQLQTCQGTKILVMTLRLHHGPEHEEKGNASAFHETPHRSLCAFSVSEPQILCHYVILQELILMLCLPSSQLALPFLPVSSSCPVSAISACSWCQWGSSHSDQCYQHLRQAFKQNTSMQEPDLVKCLSKKHLLILNTLGEK